jgi:hypothetical protein
MIQTTTVLPAVPIEADLSLRRRDRPAGERGDFADILAGITGEAGGAESGKGLSGKAAASEEVGREGSKDRRIEESPRRAETDRERAVDAGKRADRSERGKKTATRKSEKEDAGEGGSGRRMPRIAVKRAYRMAIRERVADSRGGFRGGKAARQKEPSGKEPAVRHRLDGFDRRVAYLGKHSKAVAHTSHKGERKVLDDRRHTRVVKRGELKGRFPTGHVKNSKNLSSAGNRHPSPVVGGKGGGAQDTLDEGGSFFQGGDKGSDAAAQGFRNGVPGRGLQMHFSGEGSPAKFVHLMVSELQGNHSIFQGADGVFGDLVRQFNYVVRKGGGEAMLRLQPESLGDVKLSVRLHGGEVNTSVTVDNQAVKDLIMSRMSLLEDNLMSQGFQLGSFEVEVRDRGTALQKDARSVHVPIEEEVDAVHESERGYVPWMSTIINVTV